MNNQPFQWSIWLRSKTGLVTITFLAIAAFFLVTEHTAHVFGLLPFAILLLCPLMMLFMHGGHGEHGEDHTQHGDKSMKYVDTHAQHTEAHSQHTEGIK